MSYSMAFRCAKLAPNLLTKDLGNKHLTNVAVQKLLAVLVEFPGRLNRPVAHEGIENSLGQPCRVQRSTSLLQGMEPVDISLGGMLVVLAARQGDASQPLNPIPLSV